MEEGEDREDYGLIRASLIKVLRGILDQYPDDGQILKELIQNAEDAGARVVKFLYDDNAYGCTTLHHPDMAKFQGAALYAYNDAIFSEADWTGIRMLQESVKEKDPMKVGRFGLGFKSVLHMTDLPSVLSGDRLQMIDPHEKYFTTLDGDKSTGYRWHLRDKRDKMARIPDQFAPYQSAFGCTADTFQQGYYRGTLFRFPLRSSPTALSDTLYTREKIDDLFASFEPGASTLMLFLKNLHSVELLRREKGQGHPQLCFKVSLTEACREQVLKKRREFAQAVKTNPDALTHTTYRLDVMTESYRHGSANERRTHRWLVNEYFAGGAKSREFQKLCDDPNLGYVPLVGTAMPIQEEAMPPVHGQTTNEEDNERAPTGQIFCFLPLPVEQRSSTGLPVHVNGYFSISQNRRHLKWPTEGSHYRGDKALMWNQCLLQEAVPFSYTQLIKDAISLSASHPGTLSPDHIYYALPNIVQVDPKWTVILKPLFVELFKCDLFYTPQSGGKWLRLEDCLFDCLKDSEEIRTSVLDFLYSVGTNVSKPPQYLLYALGAYTDLSPEIIDPPFVRRMLQENAQYGKLPGEVKLRIVTFVLKDECFDELYGIRLLPVADGGFVEFRSSRAWGGLGTEDFVYIPTETCPRELLPGLEARLVPSLADETVASKLRKMADEEAHNVRLLGPDTVLKLIHDVIPDTWRGQKVVTLTRETLHVSYAWLRAVWQFLHTHYPSDLSPASGLPLLPLEAAASCQLVPLTLPSSVISVSMLGTQLPQPAADLLSDIGIHVVKELPEFVTAHGAVIGNYVRLALESDVLEVMQVIDAQSEHRLADAIHSASAEQISALISVFAKLSARDVTSEARSFLRSLPLFHVVSPSCDGLRVSVNDVSQAAPDHDIPLVLEEPYLKLDSDDARLLARKLDVTFVTPATLLIESVLPKIQQRFLSNDKIEEVMVHVLDNIHSFTKDDPQFLSRLSDVPFVITASVTQEPMKPRDLFDPESKLLQDLFTDENVFPSGRYANSDLLILLRKMNLKGEKDISAKDFLYAAIHVEDMCDVDKDVSNKTAALLEFLSNQPHILTTEVNGRLLREWLADIAWAPVLSSKVSLFPDSLPWAGCDVTAAKPSDMVTQDYAFLAGSHVCVCNKHLPKQLSSALGFQETPGTDVVIKQLKSIVSAYSVSEKPAFLNQLMQIYDFLSKQASAAHVLATLRGNGLEDWVWHGDGFCGVGRAYVKQQALDLRPYAYCVPVEMQVFAALFVGCGVQESCDASRLIQVLHDIGEVHQCDDSSEPEVEEGQDATMLNEAIVDSDDIELTEAQVADISRDRKLVVDILNHLKTQDIADEERKAVLFPVQTSGNTLKLLPVDDVTYCDVEWLRTGFDVMEFDAQDGIFFIHDLVPVPTAQALHVPTLISRMLHAQELDITGFGQSEPLTDRLKRLLDDYTDGLSIPKELIQNADDAGATEVKFLYDERSNSDQMKFLMDEGMRECQGPALWLYNNAVFTDTDFSDIIKLGGATKEQEISKIGKFGLGFNAVYNVTDVPSFVSRDSIVIFDPHTTHLGRAIRDRSKPGIRIDIKRNATLLRKLSHQFSPYENVFDCHVTQGKPYDGTLFRLPLRTEHQARKSKIKQVCYNRKEVLRLLQMTIYSAHNLLLFTQNVLRVQFYHIQDGGSASDVTLLYEIEKQPLRIVRELHCPPPALPAKATLSDAQRELVANSNFLTAVNHHVKAKRKAGRNIQVAAIPQSSVAVSTVPTMTDDGRKCLGMEKPPAGRTPDPCMQAQHWLISSCMGQDQALQFAKNTKGKDFVPIGGVALPLVRHGEAGFVPKTGMPGMVFCYLPLPILSGLPVHINGAFAVASSRRTLYTRTHDDKDDTKWRWNQALMEDAIVHAYLQLLSDVKQLLPRNDGSTVELFRSWPARNVIHAEFQAILPSFYRALSSLPLSPVVYVAPQFVTLQQARFLEYDMGERNEKVRQAAIRAFHACQGDGGLRLLQVPRPILSGFEAANCHGILKEKSYNALRFYTEIVMPNIADIEPKVREVLLVYALLRNDEALDALLRDTPCIPVDPDGTVLRRPCEMVRPGSVVAQMYDADDHRFPHGELTEFRVAKALHELGMTNDVASWENLLERSASVVEKYEADVADGRKRLQSVLAALDRKLGSCQSRSRAALRIDRAAQSKVEEEVMLVWAPRFRQAAFLPTSRKPADFPMKWLGDDASDDVIPEAEVEETGSEEQGSRQEATSGGGAAPGTKVEEQLLGAEATPPSDDAGGEPAKPEEDEPRRNGNATTGSDVAAGAWCPSLMSADDLYPEELCRLVSATQPIADMKGMPARVKEFLGLTAKEAALEQVITQAQHAFRVDPSKLSDTSYDWLVNIVYTIYRFLQDICKDNEEIAGVIAHAFQNQPSILIGRTFVKPELVAFGSLSHCEPYLYGVPLDMNRRFRHILAHFGVRNYFSVLDYTTTLQAIHAQYGQRPLDESHVRTCKLVADRLSGSMREEELTAAAVEEKYGVIYMPDSAGVMHPASSLCYNDCSWVNQTQSMNFIHADIAPSVSRSLGVKTKRQTKLKEHARGIPFGQRGSLVTSIRRVLEHYPCGHEILKELIQNADDAGATEIHFILDHRSHPTDHVFEESWKPLQGPSLLVHNNKPFRTGDLEGIQNLGVGSKRQDPCKTGQYGVGFASVYHLTDAPTLLTTVGEGEDGPGPVLCVFDPQCVYAPEATQAQPGIMYDDIDNMQEEFSDVFNCYMRDFFPVSDATTFRFPLRTEAMAEKSTISQTAVDSRKVGKMLSKLKEQIFDILLFTKSLEKISVSEVNAATGKLTNQYFARSHIPGDYSQERSALREALTSARDVFRRPEVSLADMPCTDFTHRLVIFDTQQAQEEWCVSQRLGLPADHPVPESVVNAIKSGDLALLPFAGTAVRLKSRNAHDVTADGRPHRVFCCLPLPLETQLPVHINGHFALSSESRKSIIMDEGESSYKADWNQVLFEQVLAPAYVNLLMAIRFEYLQYIGHEGELESSVVNTTRQMLERLLSPYQGYFPVFRASHPELDILVRAVYQTIAGIDAPVLPCIKDCPAAATPAAAAGGAGAASKQERHQILWLPPTGQGPLKAFFTKEEPLPEEKKKKSSSSATGVLKSIAGFFSGSKSSAQEEIPAKTEAQILKEVLVDCGFKLLDASRAVVDGFIQADVDIDLMSPEGVLKFFKTFGSENQCCDVGPVPCHIKDTVFTKTDTLKVMLKYCQNQSEAGDDVSGRGDQFADLLDGTPLLMTDDGFVRTYDSDNPVFYSEFSDLLSGRSQAFLSGQLRNKIFKKVNPENTTVFKPFQIQDLAPLLENILDKETYFQCSEDDLVLVKWPRLPRQIPSEHWLKRFWTFVREQLRDSLVTGEEDPDVESRRQVISDRLEPVSGWALIPVNATLGGERTRCLVSIAQACKVLSLSKAPAEQTSIKSILRDLDLPELREFDLETTTLPRHPNYDVVQHLVATLDKPNAILNLLYDKKEDSLKSVSKMGASQVLLYFTGALDELKKDESNAEKLAHLPLYKTICGDLISVADCFVYTLPAQMPTNGIDSWQSRHGTVFLERDERMTEMYEYLGCKAITSVEVYRDFIFQHFEYFDAADRAVHVQHVYDTYLRGDGSDTCITDEEREMFQQAVHELPFIEDEDGELQPASAFYDPENDIFKTLLPSSKFPPQGMTHFDQGEWYELLRALGLIQNVTRDMFVSFVKDVARETPQSGSIHQKSQILVRHLFGMAPLDRQAVADDVKDVRFIRPRTAGVLGQMAPQYGAGGQEGAEAPGPAGALPHIAFRDSVLPRHMDVCWSSAHVLPEWADPLRLAGQGQQEREQLLGSLGIQKQPSPEVVASHLQNVCSHACASNVTLVNARLRVLRQIYHFLQEQAVEDQPEVLRALRNTACVPVDEGRKLVLANQTVLNLLADEEIPPYLYKVPAELGEYNRFFALIGSENVATAAQYASCLDQLKRFVGQRPLHPNELHAAVKAIRGIFLALQNNTDSSLDRIKTRLYLLSDTLQLVESHKLVYNDSPSFYDRVPDTSHVRFLMDMRECDLRNRLAEDTVDLLPQELRPTLLSDLVRECLVDESVVTKAGLAKELEEKIKSEPFHKALVRLTKHHESGSGKRLSDAEISEHVGRLSIIEIFAVADMKTRLVYRDKPIRNSETAKTCHVSSERIANGGTIWRVYIEEKAALNHDLLIPLAEVINTILGGMLKESVLFLIPLLTASVGAMNRTLNQLNIKEDNSTVNEHRVALYPTPGQPISEVHRRLLVEGGRSFEEDEWAGFQNTQDDPVVYCKVQMEVISSGDVKSYLVLIGPDNNVQVATIAQLFKFIEP